MSSALGCALAASLAWTSAAESTGTSESAPFPSTRDACEALLRLGTLGTLERGRRPAGGAAENVGARRAESAPPRPIACDTHGAARASIPPTMTTHTTSVPRRMPRAPFPSDHSRGRPVCPLCIKPKYSSPDDEVFFWRGLLGALCVSQNEMYRYSTDIHCSKRRSHQRARQNDGHFFARFCDAKACELMRLMSKRENISTTPNAFDAVTYALGARAPSSSSLAAMTPCEDPGRF